MLRTLAGESGLECRGARAPWHRAQKPEHFVSSHRVLLGSALSRDQGSWANALVSWGSGRLTAQIVSPLT